MKRVIGLAVVIVVFATGAAVAQQTSTQPSSNPQHERQMPGMCPMMGGMIQGGMMPGMMSMMGGQADPRMMQMRGEMMKAMGDIMLKYGKMMEGAGR